MEHVYNDGGRQSAGFKGFAGDCVVRAIAIAAEIEYQNVYDALHGIQKQISSTSRAQIAKRLAKNASPRSGVYRQAYQPYLESLGFVWFPTMQVGQGCKVHMRSDELPSGRIIVSLSKHMAAVIDGVLHDTHDCTRCGTRCVYGYFSK